jgi:hypothetical protein
MKHIDYLKDEEEWLKQETKFIDKLIPFFKKRLLIKSLILVLVFILIAKFFALFVTLLSIFLISYIRYKRTIHRVSIEIEPTYLIGIALTLAFGIEYGIAFIIIPGIFALITSGFGIGWLVNIVNKVVVIYLTYIYWTLTFNETYLIYLATFLVLLTDFLGFFVRKKFGQPFFEILQVVVSNAILRFAYFSIFLDIIVKLLK